MRRFEYLREVNGKLRKERIAVFTRWVLWNEHDGVFKEYPQKIEKLFSSREEAKQYALFYSLKTYKPTKVEIRHSWLMPDDFSDDDTQ